MQFLPPTGNNSNNTGCHIDENRQQKMDFIRIQTLLGKIVKKAWND